jgi:hypothetical protein
MLTVMTYVFPKPGKYEMGVRFMKGSGVLAEVTVPMDVKGTVSGNNLKVGLAALIIGAGIGYGAGFFSRKRREGVNS